MTGVTEPWAGSFDTELAHLAAGERADGATREGSRRFFSCLPPGYVEETAPEDAATDWLEISTLLNRRPTPASGPGLGSGPDGAAGERSDSDRPGDSETSASQTGASQTGASQTGAGQANTVSTKAGRLLAQADRLVLCPTRRGAPGDFRLRRIGLNRVELSSFLPVLESFGLVAVEAVPWHFALGPGDPDAYVDDIGLRVGTPLMTEGFDLARASARLVEALEAVFARRAELTSLNRLVLGAELDWRQVNLLCAYSGYRRVVGGPRSAESADSITGALVAFPSVADAAVRLFQALQVPGSSLSPSEARSQVDVSLAAVPDLEHDRALHELITLIEATVRSNWALGKETISLKLASSGLAFLPAPKPLSETFVWSPSFQALHVRFGLVARGGIRWSDRHSDLRGEVLGLAKAQVKKNSLIVPTGAKGAFVLSKQTGQGQEQGRAAYSAFVRGLLDITDNIVKGEVVRPEGVVCRDGDDPYLVLAPDKGTAHFSDLANSISLERGFWLGDAFASGGSHGYDHKALGITARGAWIAVRRHFRALGIDAQHEPLRVVGVGDMSGDVFGNAMLQSDSICLVAAFDHRDIFIDPTPTPANSFAERRRLSGLERSSWQDYDLQAASEGAGVYSRHAKQVELSRQARVSLGVTPGPLSPPELIRHVLGAQVDLIFFGGIGTFVKAPGESDIDVDDKANDDVRVNADHLRTRVVTEGANLAITQRARTSYSRRGGRVNADFIDNAGGVVMSDREVNLKILLGLAMSAGRLDAAGREAMLVGSKEAVASAVLAEVERSIVALDRAASSSAAELAAYEALMEDLSSAQLLDLDVEALPGAEELARRRQAGAGLSRPEVAVLVSYARSEVARSTEASPLSSDESLWPCARKYFPPGPLEAFSDLVLDHPLFRQLVSSQVANSVVEQMGPVWAHEVAAQMGRQLWEAAAAYWAAREVLAAGEFFDELDAFVWSISPEAESALREELGAGLKRLARWYLARPGAIVPEEVIASDVLTASRLEANYQEEGGSVAKELSSLGVPGEVALRAERFYRTAAAGELADVARLADRQLADVLDAYAVVEGGLSLSTLQGAVGRQSPSDRWDRWQLELLADDLARARATAAIRALQSYPDASGGDAARRWLEARPHAVEHMLLLVKHVREVPAPPLSLLTLAVRALGEAVGRRA
ncbi:MAG TPA: NAD-glutamate dehydrogenase domain-containing protein [Acidimicrobiales bacterium]|nr:NAD-glutamate dehydrogenase domain-containing protein [Acidimicrobiales bacterium]